MILYPSILMMVEGTGSLSISRAPRWSMCKKFEFPRTAKISCSQTQEKTSLRLVCFFPLKIPVGLKKGHARSQQNLQLANRKRQMSLREFVSQARAQEISSGKKSACQFPAISLVGVVDRWQLRPVHVPLNVVHDRFCAPRLK